MNTLRKIYAIKTGAKVNLHNDEDGSVEQSYIETSLLQFEPIDVVMKNEHSISWRRLGRLFSVSSKDYIVRLLSN